MKEIKIKLLLLTIFIIIPFLCFGGQTITRGKTFGSTDEVTNTLLHQLVDNATITKVTDADSDTKIDTEESADEDKVRIDTGGTERVVIDGTSATFTNDIYPKTNNSTYLGENDDDTPHAFKGIVVVDTSLSEIWRIEVYNGTVRAVNLTD